MHVTSAFKKIILTAAAALSAFSAYTAEPADTVMPMVTTTADSVPRRRNIVQKVIDYFGQTNKVHDDRKFDISVIGGPSYSEATSVEIAALVSGLYKSRRDSLTPRSDVSLYGQVSVTGFYRVGIRGKHFFPEDKIRVIYDANFCHFPLKFWGIGYANGANEDNESKYTQLQSDFTVQFLWKLPHSVFLGPSSNFHYFKATRQEKPELWDGQRNRIFCYGPGIVLSYDTRDLIENASRGVYIGFHQKFFPSFLGNHYHFFLTDFSAMFYKKFWSSGVMAFRFHAAGTYGGETPWCMLPTLDDGGVVRGYYEGRYRDRNSASLIVEMRQHVWRRNGIVVWAGAGTVFRHFSDINRHTILPTVGVGYRWEFKNRVNVRLDFGFGKHSRNFSVGINEAF